MGSRKRSARAREIAAFRDEMGTLDLGDAFDAERVRRTELAQSRDAARQERSCSRKQRYQTRADAEEAIRACAAHGTRGLSCYKCRYCGGWHLTSHPWEA